MTRLLIIISILIVGCSTERKEIAERNFSELDHNEKIELFGQLGKELKGDLLIYSGQVIFEDTTGLRLLDSTTFIQLVMDMDNRFAIRTKFIAHQLKTDSMTFNFGGGQSNKGIGRWSDLGDKFELKFQLGAVDNFFVTENNEGRLKIVDSKTVRFDKFVDEIWIWQAPCRKVRVESSSTGVSLSY